MDEEKKYLLTVIQLYEICLEIFKYLEVWKAKLESDIFINFYFFRDDSVCR